MHRFSVPAVSFFPVLALAAASLAACSTPFEAGTGGDASVSSDDGGGKTGREGGTVIVAPPDGGPATNEPGDAAGDATLDAAGESDAHEATDAETDATLGNDNDSGEPPADAAPSCSSSEKLCGSSCVSTSSPATGCAAASCSACSFENAQSACSGGDCALGACNAGFENCDGNASNGCETAISTATNCGGCNVTCPAATPYCSLGAGGTYSCVDDCPANAPTLCNGSCVSFETDVSDCGGCSSASKSYACTAPSMGTPTCSGGVCGFTCTAPYSVCGSACVDEQTSVNDCGGCGASYACTAPSMGTPTCSGGVCGFTCTSPYSACGSACIDEQTNVNNCGGCTTASKSYACAPPANATATCASGACGFQCDSGYQQCNGACVQADPTAVFVSKASSATSGCGPIGTPCGTIAAGLAYAASLSKAHVYVDQGTSGYTYPEQVTLPNGMTLEGGWIWGGGTTWTKVCSGNAAAAIIEPTGVSQAVIANDVTATLINLTIDNATVATPNVGESIYGIFATGGALTLDDVVVVTSAGGTGSPGATGNTGTGTVPGDGGVCGAGASDGGSGGPGGAGQNGTYQSTGFQVATAPAGTAGNAGSDEAGTQGSPVQCSACVSDGMGDCSTGNEVTFTPDAPGQGCGGNGGGPGHGGGGGGASIGVYAWGGTVTITGGSITSASGGKGGPGGPGGEGAAGTTGSSGCVETLCGGGCNANGLCTSPTRTIGSVCSTPGVGQTGGSGGTGGGGAGGDSYAYYAGGGASVTASGTTLTPGSGGAGGTGGTTGTSGRSGSHN